jgi:hypothetical protein
LRASAATSLIAALLARTGAAQEAGGESAAERAEKLVELVRETAQNGEGSAAALPRGVLSDLDPLKVPAEAKAIVRVLRERRVTLRLEKQDLSAVIDLLRQVSGLSFVVSRAAQTAMEKDRPQVSLLLLNLPLENALNLVAMNLGTHSFTVRDGAVILALSREIRPRLVTRLYPVQDLVRPRPDFVAPTLALKGIEDRQ